MKKLFFIRHSKALQDNLCNDFDRPLTEKGIANTHSMSKELIKQKIRPQLVISSPAIRAVSTAIIMCKELKHPLSQIILEPTLYESSIQQYLHVIKKTNNRIDSLFIFAHNPTITEICHVFSPGCVLHIPTTGVVGFSIDTNTWHEADKAPNAILTISSP